MIPSALFVAISVIGLTEYISNAFRMGGSVAAGVATRETLCWPGPCAVLFTTSAERYLGVKPWLLPSFPVALSTRMSNCLYPLLGTL